MHDSVYTNRQQVCRCEQGTSRSKANARYKIERERNSNWHHNIHCIFQEWAIQNRQYKLGYMLMQTRANGQCEYDHYMTEFDISLSNFFLYIH